ncbi:hypothetical protein BDQ17DRAFT_1323196 [Cyathus striatus]|nr:hypothetical protein BDQ17DRAFT_1323196 [Cyathus striatus]
MAQGRYPYPTFTHALLKSEAFPALQEHYRTPAKVPPSPIVPQPFFPELMKTFDERFSNGSKYGSGFFLPTELDDESAHSVSDADATNLDGLSYIGCSGDKVEKARGVLASVWRKLSNAFYRRPQEIINLPPVAGAPAQQSMLASRKKKIKV